MGFFHKDTEPVGRFVGPIEYELCETLIFVSDEIGDVWVPSGTVTDFASIPRLFWRILPPWDTHRRAAIVHDFLYSTQTQPKATADKVFLEAMKALKVPAWKAQAMYHAVKWFGFAAWNQHTKEIEGQRNFMKKLLLLAPLVLLTGCVYYKGANGEKFVSFLKKAELSGAEISKDGMKVKGAKTAGDAELAGTVAERTAYGFAKGAKP